ncbi:11684_t:CDS:1 [Paraglomus brasilianum]|uniref:11684_t:CDS:1 n=1 Tax=Paraglomus brasilianum TaxID=144538 RepID=A0A9N8Z6P4_9GLOM|nr:11684_t:CDS:1 [Paraglomus brasilianum]
MNQSQPKTFYQPMVSTNIHNTMQLNDSMTSFTGTSTSPTVNMYKSMAMQQFLTAQNSRLYCQQPLNYLQGPVYLYSQINDDESTWHSDPQPYFQPPPNQTSLIDHSVQLIKHEDEDRSSIPQVHSSTPQVHLSTPQAHLSTPQVHLSTSQVHSSTPQPILPAPAPSSTSQQALKHFAPRRNPNTVHFKHRCTWSGCIWSFKRLEHLKRHMITHTGERKYQCDFPGCGKRFGRSDNYAAHRKIHTRDTSEIVLVDRTSVRQSGDLEAEE